MVNLPIHPNPRVKRNMQTHTLLSEQPKNTWSYPSELPPIRLHGMHSEHFHFNLWAEFRRRHQSYHGGVGYLTDEAGSYSPST